MSKEVTEADTAVACAEAFGRTPPAWAVEAQKRERQAAGEPTMSVREAVDATIGAVFGRVGRAQLAEAEVVLASQHGGSGAGGGASSGDLQGRMTALMSEVASLAERKLGMSPERARLEAQSQALLCRESSRSVADAVASFERHRDAMETAPTRKRATFVDGKRVS